jgi:Holliday junction resolvase RusA-like endonuclease
LKLVYFVPGRPVPKQSYRASKFGGYQPKRVTDFKKVAQLIADHAAIRQSWERADGPVLLRLQFRFRCPTGARKADKQKCRWRISRPDLDNLQKSIIDSISDRILVDDAQICMTICTKIIAKEGDEEGTSVTLETLGEYDERHPSLFE